MAPGMRKVVGASFVVGVLAFVGTLMFSPLPPDPDAPRRATPEQRETLRGQRIAQSHGQERRILMIQDRWGELGAVSRASVEAYPPHLWGWIDLMHASAKEPSGGRAARRLARRARPIALELRERGAGWQADATLGWAAWFLGDEEAARCAWLDAAAALEAAGTTRLNAYNAAGYLSLAGEHERAIEAWRLCVELGYTDFEYARVDYDYALLIRDPRFEAIIDAATATDMPPPPDRESR